MNSAAKECQHQSELAQSQRDFARERIKKAKEQSKYVQDLTPSVRKGLQQNYELRNYREAASQRVQSLQASLNNVKIHREETNKRVNAYSRNVQQRLAEDKKRFESIQNRYEEA